MGARGAKDAYAAGMRRIDPAVMKVGRMGGDLTDDAAIRRRGQFRIGVGMGAVGVASGVSGMRAKSSGGYTGANTY